MYGSGGDASADARRMEEEREARIRQGVGQINQTFSGFNPAFYQGRQQDYINFAMPQFYNQLGQQQRGSFYNLANKGLANSGAANRVASDLGREANIQKQGIADTAVQQSNELQRNVEQQRSQLIAQLQASADPTTAAQQALSSASALSLPSPLAPLGNMFGNFASMYANQQAGNAYNQQYQPRYGLNQSPLGRSAYSIGR